MGSLEQFPRNRGEVIEPDQLASCEPELMELAQRLVTDYHRAQDLVQETYVAALQRRTRLGRSVSLWLRDVLRLKAHQTKIRERSRTRREQAAAVSHFNHLDSSRSKLASTLHALMEEVERLEEPYRSTMQKRFLEGTPPRSIAGQSGVPVRTIYTRIARGTQMLRARLDRRLGAGIWVAWLSPSQEVRAVRESKSPRHLAAIALRLASVACLGLIMWWVNSNTDRPLPPRTLTSSMQRNEAEGKKLQAREFIPSRSPAATQSDGSATSKKGPGFVPNLRGKVVDLEGRSVGGVSVKLQAGTIGSSGRSMLEFEFLPSTEVEKAVSRESGEFEGRLSPDDRGRLLARGAGFQPVIGETVGASRGAPQAREGVVLVVAIERVIQGRVTDSRGNPLVNASLRLLPAPEYLERLEPTLDRWTSIGATAQSREDGRFHMEAYAMNGATLQVTKGGFAPATFVMDSAWPTNIEIVLDPLPNNVTVVRGVVVNGQGAGIPNAIVTAGKESVETNSEGAFELPWDSACNQTLWAVQPGHLPTTSTIENTSPRRLEKKRLVIDAEALAIEGRAIDARGRPVNGALVWASDLTVIGNGSDVTFAEVLVDPAPEFDVPRFSHTDPQGRFRVPYLIDREYRLRAMWFPSSAMVEFGPFPAGTNDVLLRLATNSPTHPIAGRLVDKDGEPVSGASVALCRRGVEIPLTNDHLWVSQVNGTVVLSDSGGRFSLPATPLSGLQLRISKSGFLDHDYYLEESHDPGNLEILVWRPARFRVVAAPEHADRFSLLLNEGTPAPIFSAASWDGNLDMSHFQRAALLDGLSELLVVPDTVTHIVFYEGEEEIERAPVEVSFGYTTEY